MPIPVQETQIEHVGNGVTTVFSYPFTILSSDDLKCKIDGAPVSSGFTVSGVGSRTGGSVTFSSAPASLASVLLYRQVSLDRETDYQENGDLLASVIDDDFDRAWMAIQDIGAFNERSLRVPVGEALDDLPSAESRADRILGFNSLGEPIMVTRTEDGGSALALDLASASGASMVGYGTSTVDDSLDLLFAEQTADQIGHYARLLYDGTAVAIDCFGDSTMWGDNGGTGVQSPTTQPSRLQFFLRAYYANSAATVSNRGISGTDTAQMLAGTDGSGLTFEARISATSASVVYCNHCINDVNVGRSGTAFKANWLRIIQIIRKYGKSPVMVTPNPMLVNANATFDANAEKLRKFVDIMKQVAAEQAVPLVDQYDLVTRFMRSGDTSTITLIPDGEHPAEVLYKQMGNNLALPFVGNQCLPDIEGFLPAFLPQFESTGTNGSKAIQQPRSRVGGARWTDATGTQTIRLAVYVPEGGCDLYLAQMLWDEGTTLGAVTVDFVSAGTMSWYQNVAYTGQFNQDYEVCVARNVAPGLHYVECANGGAGRLGVNYLRVRESIRPKSTKGTGNTTTTLPTFLRSVRMLDRVFYQPQSAADSSVVLFDELPTRGLFEEHVVEVDATLYASQFVVLRGSNTSSAHIISGAGNPRPQIAVGLDASGFLTCYEFTPSFARATNFDTTNRGGVANIYRFETFNGQLKVYVNNTQIGSTLTLLEPNLKGGNVGLYTFNSNLLMTINSISYVYTV